MISSDASTNPALIPFYTAASEETKKEDGNTNEKNLEVEMPDAIDDAKSNCSAGRTEIESALPENHSAEKADAMEIDQAPRTVDETENSETKEK